MKYKILPVILLCACLSLSACNVPVNSGEDSSALSTFAAQTVQAVLTPEATQALATLAPQETPTSQTCEDNAQITSWTRDGVAFDAKEAGKALPPNTVFTMVWTLQNAGTCTWNSVYQMYFDSGTSLTGSANFPVIPTGSVVPPGGTINVSIPMTAPEKVGEYESSFRLQNDRGDSVINVGVPTKVGSASSASLSSPGDLRYAYDCTGGTVNITLNWTDKSSDEDGFRIYRDGVKLADVAAGITTYSDIAPSSGKYDYTVAAYNGSGESPARVNAITDNCQ